MQKTKPHTRLLILALFCVALLCIVCLGIGCPIRSLTGIPCPGCGLTRAWKAALQLEFADAFRYHPLFWSVPVLMAFCCFNGQIFRQKWLNIGILGLIGLGFAINYLVMLLAFLSGDPAV